MRKKILLILMIDAWQRGVITRRIFLSFDGSGLRINAITVTFVMLNRNVLTVFLVALRQFGAHERFATQFFFDLFEARTAIGSRLGGTATRALDFDTRSRIDAPGITGRTVVLFGFVITVVSAFRRVETGRTLTTTFFHDFSVAWALFGQNGVHHESNHMGSIAARDFALLTGSNTAVGDLFTGVFVDAPAVAGRTVMLGGFEQTFGIAAWDVVADGAHWTQSFGFFDIAHGALGITTETFSNLFASVWFYAPASADGTVALGRLEEAVFSALRHIFAGHGLSSIVSSFRAGTFSALCGH